MNKGKAIFFDRDGVVNYRMVKDYVKRTEEFNFIPDFFSFFLEAKRNGYYAFLITNQQGIGKGVMTEDDLALVHGLMQMTLQEKTGFCFDEIYYCTDLAEMKSLRRKPNPGMLLEAISKWNIDVERSWMIGDRRSDILAGTRAGVRTLLIGCENYDLCKEADFKFLNLIDALEFFWKNNFFLKDNEY